MCNNQKDQMNHTYFLRDQYFIPMYHMCTEDICWLCLVQIISITSFCGKQNSRIMKQLPKLRGSTLSSEFVQFKALSFLHRECCAGRKKERSWLISL